MTIVKLPLCARCGVPHVPEEIAERVRAGERISIDIIAGHGVAANVLAHGTGALHIDACRVATGESLNGRAYTGSLRRREGYCATDNLPGAAPLSRARNGIGEYEQPAGRWPSNVLLSHIGGPGGCQPAGVRRVRDANARTCKKPADRAKFERTYRPMRGDGAAWSVAADGYETVDAWTCHPQCPIRLLDEQAGPGAKSWRERKMVAGHRNTLERTNTRDGGGGYDDAGGPSRFFPTFPGPDPEGAVPFRYQPKASRTERNAGLDGLPERRSHSTQRTEVLQCPCGNKTLGASWPTCPRCGADMRDGERVERNGLRAANHHPTVKPLGLMSWLVRLIASPGAVILDPFCGSGSTGVACVREGFGFIGIEAEAGYVDIARARIAHEQEQRSGPLFAGVGTAATAAR